jgi:very-short-patch-repair endonuclease
MDHNAPYESPIEQYLFIKLRSHFAPNASLTPQVSFKTQCGIFRVDALLNFAERKVAVECDGKDYHNGYRDEWRDSILLGERHITDIVRFSGANIIDVPLVCISDLARWYAECFTIRGVAMLMAARKEVEFQFEEDDGSYGTYLFEGEHRCYGAVRRFSSERRDMWQGYYKFALRNPGKTLDRIIELWKQSDRGAARVVNGR